MLQLIAIINLIRLTCLLLIAVVLYPVINRKSYYLFLYLAGPSFIKLGQTLATRPDLIGEKNALLLSKFQDKIPPFSQRTLKKILKKHFDQGLFTVFSSFDFKAVASASIAQVHYATLKSGEKVAVKILRPNIENIIRRDLITIEIIAKILVIFNKFTAKIFNDIAKLLENTSNNEIHLLNEAANASKLKEDLAMLEGFYVPKIYWQFSGNNVLVLEWISGIPLTNINKIRAGKYNLKKVAENLVISYFNQVYLNGFFHADMHPGNLFLMKDGRLAVVDFGIMGIIDQKTRLAITQILLAFVNRNYYQVADLHIKNGLVPATINIDALALSCRKIGETIVDVAVKEVEISKLITGLIAITKEHQLATRPELLLLQKTLILVEGVGVSLDSELNIWEFARPWVKEWARTHLGFDAKICNLIRNALDLAKDFAKNLETNHQAKAQKDNHN